MTTSASSSTGCSNGGTRPYSGATSSPAMPRPTSPGASRVSTGWPPGGCRPCYFSKLLPGFLFVFLAICLFKIGTRLADRRLGWTMVACFWLMPFFLDNLSGGLSRVLRRPAPGPLLAGLAGAATLGHRRGPPAPGPVHPLHFPGGGPGGAAGLAHGPPGPGPPAAFPGPGRPLLSSWPWEPCWLWP